MRIINLIISSILQVGVFLLIPFLWWFITARKKSNFLNWIGLKNVQIKDMKKFLFYFSLTFILLIIPSTLIIPLVLNQSSMATSQFLSKGFSSLLPSIIYSFIQTGLSEELFFRGFLLKRLINKFGFLKGNLTQAFIFGMIHLIMIISLPGFFPKLIVFLITSVAAFAMGWLNEKFSEGSILPSFLLHSLTNLVASLIAMFNVLN